MCASKCAYSRNGSKRYIGFMCFCREKHAEAAAALTTLDMFCQLAKRKTTAKVNELERTNLFLTGTRCLFSAAKAFSLHKPLCTATKPPSLQLEVVPNYSV
uniref:Uncharacterized protein n=1 Tax=Rhipicephalus zambeziensis TaxID=60191 RepID=A0A224YFT5_9ACAR